jgi:hypothetical protein
MCPTSRGHYGLFHDSFELKNKFYGHVIQVSVIYTKEIVFRTPACNNSWILKPAFHSFEPYTTTFI